MQRALADFLPSDSGSVQNVYDLAVGEGSYDALEIKIANYDFSIPWRFNRNLDEIRETLVRTDTEEVQERIKETLPEMKEKVLGYAKKVGVLPEEFDFKMVKLPPFGSNRSNWNANLQRMEITDDGFLAKQIDGKITLEPSYAYIVLFHEVLGHALHDYHSKKLPLTLQLGGYAHRNIVSKPVAEGIAEHMEEQAQIFLRENMCQLMLTETDIQRAELRRQSDTQRLLINIFHAVVKEREFREKGFEVYQYVKTLTDNTVAARDLKEKESFGFNSAILESGYFRGYDIVKEVKDSVVKKKFGEKLAKHPEAIMMGCWGWKTYPKFVEWYLENVKD